MGVRVHLVEGDVDQFIARYRSKGRNSPADVPITVDAARLARALAERQPGERVERRPLRL